jgi:hypothetical protein
MEKHKMNIAIIVAVAIIGMLLLYFIQANTGQAYSRSLGRSTGKAFAKGCLSNEDCPEGTACRTHGVFQRFRKKAKTACMSICEDPEKNRIPPGIKEALKAEHKLDKVSGFNPFKSRPSYYRPRNSFETYGYTSDCKDDATLVEPFCVNGGTNQAFVATLEIPCASIGSNLKCIKDDNLFGTCGQEGGKIEGEEEDEVSQGSRLVPSRAPAETGVHIPKTTKEASELEEDSTEAEIVKKPTSEPEPEPAEKEQEEPEETFEVPAFEQPEEEEEAFEVPVFDETEEESEE